MLSDPDGYRDETSIIKTDRFFDKIRMTINSNFAPNSYLKIKK